MSKIAPLSGKKVQSVPLQFAKQQDTALFALCLAFVILWSSGWVASSAVVQTAGTVGMLCVRYLIVVAVLSVLVSVTRQWRRLSVGTVGLHLLVGSLVHAMYLLAGVGAFALGASAAVVAFITALQPALTGCVERRVTGERVTRLQWRGLALGFLSVVLMMSDSIDTGATVITLVLPCVAVLAFSAGALLQRRREIMDQKTRTPPTPLLLMLLLHTGGALLVFLAIGATTGSLQWQFSASEWGIIVWLALVVSLGAYGVFLMLLRHLSAAKVSALTYLVPPMTLVQAYLFFR